MQRIASFVANLNTPDSISEAPELLILDSYYLLTTLSTDIGPPCVYFQVHEMHRIASFVANLNSTRRSPSGTPPLLLGYDLAHAAGNVPLQLHE
jgi:hypothetical protein